MTADHYSMPDNLAEVEYSVCVQIVVHVEAKQTELVLLTFMCLLCAFYFYYFNDVRCHY